MTLAKWAKTLQATGFPPCGISPAFRPVEDVNRRVSFSIEQRRSLRARAGREDVKATLE